MRRIAGRPAIIVAVMAVLILVVAVVWLRLSARVDRLSRALDQDLLAHSRETFPRPPFPGPVEEGTAVEFHEQAFVVVPPLPVAWVDFLKHTRETGAVPAEALPLLDAAQDALRLVERGAHTRASGLWNDLNRVPVGSGNKVSDLCQLASLDAVRLLGEGEFRSAVDRCLAGGRLARDQCRFWSPSLGTFSAWLPLQTLVQIADRLPPEEIDRAVDVLAIEASIPDFLPIARAHSLYLQSSFRRALAGVDDDLFRWGPKHERDAFGGIANFYSTRGIKGFYSRKTSMARVRSRVPEAWELLRGETASFLSRGSASATFERECNRSENPVIREIGLLEGNRRYRQGRARAELEATILAILAIKFEQTEGRLPGSLEEIRPPSVRPSPYGSRWSLRTHPRTGRPGIWLIPFEDGHPIQGL